MPNRLDYLRPNIRLRNNRCIKFKNILKQNYQLYLKSPMSRGIKIWDTLTIELQLATTKVKFRQALKPYVYTNSC